MAQSIKDVFDEIAPHVVIDAKLLKRIHDYERAFINRNEDHIAFFGSPLMGVHPMRFRPTDRDNWFNDVLDIDEVTLFDEIRSLAFIPEEWKRANDVMNITCIWLLYKIQNSTKLSTKDKQDASVNVLLILQYKFLGSLMAHWFPYGADEAVMLAAYAQLSRKFAIKVAGSWGALLRERAERQLLPTSIWRRTYMTLSPDKAVGDMISDIQSRLRELVKSYSDVFYSTRDQDMRIASERSVLELNGEKVLQDKSRRYSSYVRYAHEVIGDKPSFIRADLVRVVCDVMHTMNPRLFTETLEWMSLHHRHTKTPEVEKLVDETLLFAFDLMERERDLLNARAGLMPLTVRLRALYMASRMSDPVLIQTKELSEKIVVSATASKNASVIAGVRTGIQLYIVLRTLAMHHYQK